MTVSGRTSVSPCTKKMMRVIWSMRYANALTWTPGNWSSASRIVQMLVLIFLWEMWLKPFSEMVVFPRRAPFDGLEDRGKVDDVLVVLEEVRVERVYDQRRVGG